MHKLLISLLATALAACSANPRKQEKSADQAAIDDLDHAFTEHIRSTALPRSVATAAGLKEPLGRKVEGVKVLERSYASFAEAKEPAVVAHALRRAGQLYLNVGCEIATMQVTVGSNPEFAPKVKAAMQERAQPMLSSATDLFRRAAEVEDGGEHAQKASTLMSALRSSGNVAQACTATAAEWEAPNRPEVIAKPTVDRDRCFADMYIGPEDACAAVFDQACADGEVQGCYGLGLVRFEAGESELALESFDRACELGGSCTPKFAISIDQRRDQYVQKCDAGDPIGCLQLARLLDGDPPTVRSCKATSVPTAGDAAKRCEAGEAAGCWARAGELLAKKPVELPTMVAGLLGRGFGTGGKKETREERKARLARECEAKKSYRSCVQLAEMKIEDGEDPEPSYRTACTIDAYGCHILAKYLLEQDDKAKTVEAVDLLTKTCAGGHGPSCETAARMFVAGDRVPQSAACAAALSWRRCAPDRDWDCHEINRVFGHDKKPQKDE